MTPVTLRTQLCALIEKRRGDEPSQTSFTRRDAEMLELLCQALNDEGYGDAVHWFAHYTCFRRFLPKPE